jgi:hypothetical protein
MNAACPPLLSRLRRRLATVAWLFALLVLTQSAFAAPCFADELEHEATTAAIAADASHAHAAVADADAGQQATSADHAKRSPPLVPHERHCACAHATALPMQEEASLSVVPARFVAPLLHADADAVPPRSLLRPPIA